MPETATSPGTTVAINHRPPGRNVTCGEAMKAGVLVKISEATLGNGVAFADANHGNLNSEGMVEQIEVPAKHPQSTTAYDKSTDFAINDPAWAVEHIIGRTYWLRGSTITITKHNKIICANDGLVDIVAAAHDATPLCMFTWICLIAVSAATWVQGKFMGLTTVFTTTT